MVGCELGQGSGDTLLFSARGLWGLGIQGFRVLASGIFLSGFPGHVIVLLAGLILPPTGHMQCALATDGPTRGQPAIPMETTWE